MRRFLFFIISSYILFVFAREQVFATPRWYRLGDFEGHPPIHVHSHSQTAPVGLAPSIIKSIYHLPSSGGKGVIAIVDAYDDPNIEKDLAVFDNTFHLSACTVQNGCLTKHKMSSSVRANSAWALEETLDVEWVHAIAPDAKILLVESRSSKGPDLIAAVDWAKKQPGVTAVSMSWGGQEFATEKENDDNFVQDGVQFFASAGDSGMGAEWPSVSPNVIAVGGTTLHFSKSGAFVSETAWSGSGGGISSFEDMPAYQVLYKIANTHGKRAVPDVSYNADPVSGYAIYSSIPYNGKTGWFSVGGTSAGAPQWAAMKALSNSISLQNFYKDALSDVYSKFFRDIVKGKNGGCGSICSASKNYDFVTGLGSPLGIDF